MKKIRRNLFETNSSSTHAIVVPKEVDEENYSLYDSLDHDYGFGREECRLVDNWDEKLAYVYLVLKDSNNKKDIANFKNRINTIYNDINVSSSYSPNEIFNYIDSNRNDGDITGQDGFNIIMFRGFKGVDHTEDLFTNGFVERILSDDEFLKRFIFNKDSYITIGGDEYRGYNIKTIGFEYDYEDGEYRMNEKGEFPPKEWFDKNGCIKDKYWNQYWNQYKVETGEFWNKLKKYEETNDVYLKGN